MRPRQMTMLCRFVLATILLAPATALADVAPRCSTAVANGPPGLLGLALPIIVMGALIARRRDPG